MSHTSISNWIRKKIIHDIYGIWVEDSIDFSLFHVVLQASDIIETALASIQFLLFPPDSLILLHLFQIIFYLIVAISLVYGLLGFLYLQPFLVLLPCRVFEWTQLKSRRCWMLCEKENVITSKSSCSVQTAIL